MKYPEADNPFELWQSLDGEAPQYIYVRERTNSMEWSFIDDDGYIYVFDKPRIKDSYKKVTD